MGLGKGLLNSGKWLGTNTLNSYAKPYQGNFAFHAAGAALGAGAGGILGARSDSDNGAMVGAGIGGAIGGMALPILGMTGAVGVSAASSLYKNGPKIMGGIGKAAGMAGMGVAAVGAPVAYGAGKAAVKYGNTALGMMGDALKYTPERTYFDEKKNKLVTKRGKMSLNLPGAARAAGVAGLIAAPALINKGIDEIHDMRKGQSMGVQRATPSYLNNAGATGDLVFAMHQNRRG